MSLTKLTTENKRLCDRGLQKQTMRNTDSTREIKLLYTWITEETSFHKFNLPGIARVVAAVLEAHETAERSCKQTHLQRKPNQI